MADASEILVVGGYGVVGRRVSAHLARTFPGRVLIGGRNARKAVAICTEVGHGARPLVLDIHDREAVDSALGKVGTVMCCVSQQERHLLRASIERGLAYTDIAPELGLWQDAQALADDARRSGARILLGAGLCPGVPGVMARQLASALSTVERIETAILISLGDEYGPDSLAYMLGGAAEPWEALEDGRQRRAVPFGERKSWEFPAPLGRRTAYLFPWTDTAYFPKSLGAKSALGWLALDPPWAARLLATLVSPGLHAVFEHPRAARRQRQVVEWLQRRYRRRDWFAITARVQGGGGVRSASLVGRHQADVTAAVAAELARELTLGQLQEPGVWLPEQVVSPKRFFAALAPLGYQPSFGEAK